MIENRHVRRCLARTRVTAARTLSPSFWSFAFLALLALAVQSFVVQTHIHIPQTTGRAQTVSIVALAHSILANDVGSSAQSAQPAPRDRFPITEDPTNCPLCQEVAHSGQFVASAAALASVPVTATVRFIVFAEVAPYVFAASHTWRGRAPPQA
jgi:hypothetical protein